MPKLRTRTPRMYHDRNRAYVKIDGQRIPLGPWDSEQAQEAYDRLIAEWLTNGRRLPPPTAENEPTTVAEVLVAYYKYARTRNVPNKLSSIRSALRVPRELYGSEPAESFGPKRLAVCRDRMLEQDWSRNYTNDACRYVKRAFRRAASYEMIPSSVHSQLETLEPLKHGEGGAEPKVVTPVPRSAIRRTRRMLTRPVRGLVDLQLLTGARAKELVQLRPIDIDMSREVWTCTLEQHKTAHRGKQRTIYFGPRAQRVLRQFMGPGRPVDKPIFSPRQSNAEAKAGGKGRRPNQKPNPRKTDRKIADQYTTASYRRAVERATRKANVEKWTPHRLRHNAATYLRREFGIDVAAVILGHSTLAVTATYAELNDKKAIEVMAKVG